MFFLYFGYKYTVFHGKDLFNVTVLVETGHAAIVFNNYSGVKSNIYKEGWHLRVPMLERPIIFDL